VETFGSAVLALAAPSWVSVEGFTPASDQSLRKACHVALPALNREMTLLEEFGFRALISTDPEFPQTLKTIPDPPLVLYVRGSLLPTDNLAVALVGTRRASPYGRAVAERLARELSEISVTVVSGLALGIDTASHVAAIKAGGRTLGVLGSGLNRPYPRENTALMERVAAQGAVLSEFPLETAPDRPHFPRRNRIISGLSLAVVVVEAREKSGALITARLATEQGRDVLAVPGSIFSPGSWGPHLLIREGARPVESVKDLVEEIQVFQSLQPAVKRPIKKTVQTLSSTENRLMTYLTLDPSGMDDLLTQSGLSIGVLSSTLLSLELKGLARSLPGNNYVSSGVPT
jgi:DNA processing protein